MALPKITGPDAVVHTVTALDFPSLRLLVKVGYIPGPVLDRIDEQGRQTNLQRMLDARAVKIGALVADGMTIEEAERAERAERVSERDGKVAALVATGQTRTAAEAAVPGVDYVPVLVADIAPATIAASVIGWRVDNGDTAGLGDSPAEWETFTADDIHGLWFGINEAGDEAWPEWAKDRLYRACRNFSTTGGSDPKVG